jgi:branched-chain amino acid transport system ATP-binding protein
VSRPLLCVRDLAIQFGGVRAVDGATFDVMPGEVFTIIGPNGAGKSTIFNLVSRIYDATAGTIVFDGHDITRMPVHRIAAQGIARTFQNNELFEYATVLQNLLVGRHRHRRTGLLAHVLFTPGARREEEHHRRKVEEVIDFLDLQHYRDQSIAGLPYGVRKKVELGRALAAEPKLLLLDEPSSGLNVEETEEMSFWISDIKKLLGITVVMIEHDMSLVNDVSDRVLALNYGKVIAVGTPSEVQAHPEVVRAYLGSEDTA